MKDFDWTSFTIKIAIKADLKILYAAWVNKSEIEKWFLSEARYVNGSVESKLATVNANYFWKWFLYDDTETGKITKANGRDTLEFTFAGNCLVTIELSEENDHIVVKLTQSNIPTDDTHKKNIRLGCHDGWSFYLVNLKSVYEGGLDLRNKDVRFKPMLNN